MHYLCGATNARLRSCGSIYTACGTLKPLSLILNDRSVMGKWKRASGQARASIRDTESVIWNSRVSEIRGRSRARRHVKTSKSLCKRTGRNRDSDSIKEFLWFIKRSSRVSLPPVRGEKQGSSANTNVYRAVAQKKKKKKNYSTGVIFASTHKQKISAECTTRLATANTAALTEGAKVKWRVF